MRALIQTGLMFYLFVHIGVNGFAQFQIITTYAGPGLPANRALAIKQPIDYPESVVVDSSGNFYVASSTQNRIYRVDLNGILSVVAGAGPSGYGGDGGPAILARLNGPAGMAIDPVGNLYIADSNNYRIRKVSVTGTIVTVAGNGIRGFSGDGGPATSAQLSHPTGIAIDFLGSLYIVDRDNSRIRKVEPSGTISTVAEPGTVSRPEGVIVDPDGNLYIADSSKFQILKVTPSGIVNMVAGDADYTGYKGDDIRPATSVSVSPKGVALDLIGNLYIADNGNNRIRKVTPSGIISTVAGNGTFGYSGDGGPATSARLNYPTGVAIDAEGNLYIADYFNPIRKVTPSGTISTVAGNGIPGFSGDDGPPPRHS
jgi:sugar lactone lactonase YvrE